MRQYCVGHSPEFLANDLKAFLDRTDWSLRHCGRPEVMFEVGFVREYYLGTNNPKWLATIGGVWGSCPYWGPGFAYLNKSGSDSFLPCPLKQQPDTHLVIDDTDFKTDTERKINGLNELLGAHRGIITHWFLRGDISLTQTKMFLELSR